MNENINILYSFVPRYLSANGYIESTLLVKLDVM